MNFLSKPIPSPKDYILIEKVKQKISKYQNFNIFTHKNPDGDAIGSILALYHILNKQGKNIKLFVFDSVENRFSFFPGFEKISVTRSPELLNNALVVFVDCYNSQRTGFEDRFFIGEETVVIDHHLANKTEQADAVRIINASASSAAEVVYDLATYLNWQIDRDASTCLLGGLASDTGTFQHSNTSPKSLRIVSSLVKNGTNLKKITEQLFKKREFDSSLKVWGEVLSRTNLDLETKMAYSYVTQEDLMRHNSDENDLTGLINLLSGIPESKFSLILIETKFGYIKGSMRSEFYKGVDVAKIAESFGGGGHKLAAGFEVKGTILEKEIEIKKKIREELIKQLGGK